jgi:hypothetical protein
LTERIYRELRGPPVFGTQWNTANKKLTDFIAIKGKLAFAELFLR